MWYFAWVFVLLAHPLITTTAAFSLFLCSVAPYLSSVQALWCVFESRRPIRGCLPCPEVYCLSLQQQAKPSSHCWQGEWGWWAGVWTSLRKLLQWVAAPPASCRNSGRIIRVKRCTSCPQFEGADHNRQKLLQWLAPPPVSCRYLYSGRIMRVQRWTLCPLCIWANPNRRKLLHWAAAPSSPSWCRNSGRIPRVQHHVLSAYAVSYTHLTLPTRSTV